MRTQSCQFGNLTIRPSSREFNQITSLLGLARQQDAYPTGSKSKAWDSGPNQSPRVGVVRIKVQGVGQWSDTVFRSSAREPTKRGESIKPGVEQSGTPGLSR
jgi:hypothetical protein